MSETREVRRFEMQAREIIDRILRDAFESTYARTLETVADECEDADIDFPSQQELLDDALALALGDDIGCLAEEECTPDTINLLWIEDILAKHSGRLA